jgi:hypothetical protein
VNNLKHINNQKGGKLNHTKLDDYLDMLSFVDRYPQFKVGQMRWFVVRKKELGLEPAIKRLGRRLYFHVPTFLKWIEAQKS